MPAVLLFIAAVAYSVGRFRAKRWPNDTILFIDGLFVGTSYFVLLPLSFVFLSGSLPLPPEFYPTALGDILTAHHEQQLRTFLLLILGLIPLDLAMMIIRARLQRTSRTEATGNERSKFSRVGPQTETHESPFTPRHVAPVLSAYMTLTLLVLFMTGLTSGGHWYVARHNFLHSGGFSAIIVIHFTNALRTVLVALVASLVFENKLRPAMALLIFAVVALLELYATGNRIFIFQCGIVIGYWIIVHKGIRVFSIFALAAIPLGLAMSLFRYVRAFMHSTASVLDGLRVGIQFAMDYAPTLSPVEFISGITESVNVNLALSAIEVFPAEQPFLNGSTYAKVLLAPLPRSILPSKPIGISAVAADMFAPPEAITTFNTTFFGELWMNFGYMGILIIPFLTLPYEFILYKTRRILGSSRNILALLIGVTIIRMPYSDVMLQALAAIVMLILLARIGHRLRPKQTSSYSPRQATP